jgi:hypothetical protein
MVNSSSQLLLINQFNKRPIDSHLVSIKRGHVAFIFESSSFVVSNVLLFHELH